MGEPSASTTWRLTPEALIAACALLEVEALPHSRFVDGEDAAGHVYGVGMRSLLIARLATAGEEDADAPALEAHLAYVLLALLGDDHQAIGQLSAPGGEHHTFTVGGDAMYSLVETDRTVDLIREPLADGVDRLRRLVDRSLPTAASTPDARHVSVGWSRWIRLVSGGPARASDDPLVLRAAAAAHADAMWEATCLVTSPDGGHHGVTLGWFADPAGVAIVEPGDADLDGESSIDVRTAAGVATEVGGLWDALLAERPAAGGSVVAGDRHAG